eukprot:TRINITY_DN46639_c0_g1_i1.p1 TRINITY_DN46639_c0_g1~~TRINITY_DN46639_c0_g1_i1.p1  ORF type:complete len:585 (+),score=146.72 TRINITY_DN46639_c0_g1_i1:75-1829(+)
MADDSVRCRFCTEPVVIGHKLSLGPFHLPNTTDPMFCHLDCLRWIPGVSVDSDGQPEDQEAVVHALQAAEKMICCSCGGKGGCIDCDFEGCDRTYHFSCARQKGAMFLDDYCIFCPEHAHLAHNSSDDERREKPGKDLNKEKEPIRKKKLKKRKDHKGGARSGPSARSARNDSDSSGENRKTPIFEVETILSHKPAGPRRSHTLYYVKWSGYSDSENTWEPEENFYDKSLIKAYFENLKEQSKQQKVAKKLHKEKEKDKEKPGKARKRPAVEPLNDAPRISGISPPRRFVQSEDVSEKPTTDHKARGRPPKKRKIQEQSKQQVLEPTKEHAPVSNLEVQVDVDMNLGWKQDLSSTVTDKGNQPPKTDKPAAKTLPFAKNDDDESHPPSSDGSSVTKKDQSAIGPKVESPTLRKMVEVSKIAPRVDEVFASGPKSEATTPIIMQVDAGPYNDPPVRNDVLDEILNEEDKVEDSFFDKLESKEAPVDVGKTLESPDLSSATEIVSEGDVVDFRNHKKESDPYDSLKPKFELKPVPIPRARWTEEISPPGFYDAASPPSYRRQRNSATMMHRINFSLPGRIFKNTNI